MPGLTHAFVALQTVYVWVAFKQVRRQDAVIIWKKLVA